jgi:hypothetical protein
MTESTTPQEGTVVELLEIPAPEPGSPAPVMLCREGEVILAYHATLPEKTSSPPTGTSSNLPGDIPSTAVVTFFSVVEVSLGGPNDETLHAHPLYGQGLGFYAAHEVLCSAWLRAIEKRNSVHPRHSPDIFASMRHLIITFHDSTFECLADAFAVAWHPGSPMDALAREWLGWSGRA